MAGSSDPLDRALSADSPTALVRSAGPDDVPDLVRLINTAFAVERFFKRGDRTTGDEVRDLGRRGEFLLLEGHAGRRSRMRLLDAARR